MRISLIGTTHAERGLANTGELLAILERCKPEVIFAEIPATHAERYANASHATLESIAVARYLASNQAEVVPVDLAEPEEKFFDDSKEMFMAVERRSPKYRRLVDRNTDEVRAGGFRYLNSDQCMQAWEDIYREVLETIEWIGDRRLREIYDLWSQVNASRDREMMRNIGLYSARSAAARGAFLVGAAHRKSIIGMAYAGSGTGLPAIEWDLGGFLG